MDERLKELYNIERDKLGVLPDADADLIALFNAWERYEKEFNKE